MRNFICSLSNKIIKISFILFIIFFSLSCIFTTYYLDFGNPGGYYIVFEKGFNIYNIVLTFLLLIAIFALNKKRFFEVKEKTVLIIEITMFFICGIVLFVMHDKQYLGNDSRDVMHAAASMLKGDYSVLDFKSYMNANPNNFGLFTFDLILQYIFKEMNTAINVFRLVNLFFGSLIYIYLYRITKLLFNNYSVNMNLLLIFLGFNQVLFSSMFAYGNIISYSLAIISVFYLLNYFKRGKLYYLALSIIAIILSIFIRRNSLIILIAEVIYIVLYVIKTKKIVILSSLILIAGLLFIVTTGVEKYYGSLVNYDYSKTSMPTCTWIAYGLNYSESTPGRWFDEYDKIHVDNNFETDLIKVEAKQFINHAIETFINNPNLAINFFIRKFGSSWCDPRYDSFTRAHNTLHPLLEEDYFQNSLTCYWDSWLSLISIGLLLLLVKKNSFKLEYMLPAVCIIGGFLFHAFWEVKALYCLQYVLFVLPYAALGFSKVNNSFFN